MPQKKTYNRRRTMYGTSNSCSYRYRKRRRYGYGNYNRQTIVRSPTSLQGFGTKQLVKLKYANDFELPTGANSYFAYVFRGASVFDPDQTGGTGTAAGVAIWQTVYDKYSVYKSEIKVTFCNQSDNHMSCFVLPYLSSSQLPVAVPRYDMQANCRSAIIGAYQSGNDIATIRHKAYTKTILNVDPFSTDTSVAWTDNPAFNWFWHVCVETVNGTVGNSVMAHVEIIYYVICSGRKTINPA